MKAAVRAILVIVFLLPSACQSLAKPSAQTASPTTDTPISPTDTTVPPTDTPEPDLPCAYLWANEPLPGLSAQLQEAVDQVNMQGVTLRAAAFGENCVLPDGRVKVFLAMQTDFYLVIPVEDIKDNNAMAEKLVEPLRLILRVPPEELSGPNPGRVEVRFSSGSQDRTLHFPVQQARESLQADPSGAQLVELLEP